MNQTVLLRKIYGALLATIMTTSTFALAKDGEDQTWVDEISQGFLNDRDRLVHAATLSQPDVSMHQFEQRSCQGVLEGVMTLFSGASGSPLDSESVLGGILSRAEKEQWSLLDSRALSNISRAPGLVFRLIYTQPSALGVGQQITAIYLVEMADGQVKVLIASPSGSVAVGEPVDLFWLQELEQRFWQPERGC